MIIEFANYLTEYGTSEYSVGFQFIRKSIDFKVLFFILKRKKRIDREKRKKLIDFYIQNNTKKYKESKCVNIDKTKVELNQTFLNELDCELILVKEFDENNFHEDFTFDLEIPIEEGGELSERIQFCIKGTYLAALRQFYRDWYDRYKSKE